MKKILLTLFTAIFISLAAFAQNYTFTVFGNVMLVVENSVTPVSGQAVTIRIDSSFVGFTYENTVYTNESGYYEDVIEIPGYNGSEYVYAMTYDSCLGQYLYNGQFLAPGATLQPMDFYLCNSVTPDCQANFYYNQANPNDPLTFTFENLSYGDYTEVYWSFGDSTFSTEISPTHTFPGAGTYYVCLTISDGAECSSTYCDFVYAGGDPWNECESYFYYNYNESYTLTFEGYLYSGQYAQSYIWNFGDGTTGTGQTVTHTYTPQGNINAYLVSLTTVVMDSLGMDSCFYTSTQEVWIQNMPGCNAYFTYYPDSVDQKTVYFLDLSYDPNGLPPTSWLWEFGDGTGSTEQNPMHTYADTGYYSVCLTIFTGADSCSSTYCEDIYTGIIPPPGGCESFILYMNMVDLTVDFEGYTVSQYETEYTWDFGDGVSGTGQFITHTFPTAGMYNITLQTIDATGCMYRTFSQIWLDSLNQGNCSAYFSYEPVDSTTFTFSGVVYFNNGMIYPDSSTVFSWDFGDGTTGSGQTITHYFQENPSGGYNVCLTATAVLSDGTTCTSTYCEYVYTTAPSFSIFGFVYLAGNTLADQAEVHLMTMDTTWQGVTEVQTVIVDSGGFYNFPGIPLYNTRLYYVQAELTEGSAYFGDYLPTYHISALNWEQANPVLPLNNWTADIYMIAGTTMDAGTGEINGVVSDLGTRGYMEGVEVVLLNEESSPLVYSRSDSQGGFSFTGLPMGTYIIHAELMGIHTVQAEVTLSEQNPGATVEVQVSGGEAYVVFGIPEQPASLENVSDIYPNPVNENSRFDLTLKSASTVEISIVNLTGQKLAAEALKLDKGTHSYNLNTSALPEGIYLIRVRSEQGDEVIRKFMKSR